MIEKVDAVAYYAPTRGRRYFTKLAAAKAEAKAIIFNHRPIEPYEPDTGTGYHIQQDNEKEYNRLFARLMKILYK